MAITATLYRPNQAPKPLDAARRSLLSITLGKTLTAHTRTVAAYLGVLEADLLYSDESVAIWGAADAEDYLNQFNEHASLAIAELELPLSPAQAEELADVVGPILLIVND